MPDSFEIVIEVTPHPRYGWLMVPVQIPGDAVLDMALNPGVPRSSIGATVQHDLMMRELLPPVNQREYVLADAAIQGQRIPPLTVRVSRVRLPGADGIIGLDFLAQFTDIHFHVPSFRLTLSNP